MTRKAYSPDHSCFILTSIIILFLFFPSLSTAGPKPSLEGSKSPLKLLQNKIDQLQQEIDILKLNSSQLRVVDSSGQFVGSLDAWHFDYANAIRLLNGQGIALNLNKKGFFKKFFFLFF